jgi:hypothetical protein
MRLSTNEPGCFRRDFSPPRTIHFTKDEVYWECKQTVSSEKWPYGLPEMCKWNSLPSPEHICPISPFELAINKPGNDDSGFNLTSATSSWTELVEVYSSCKLSFSADKLVAISALARHIAEGVGFGTDIQYRAGIWQLRYHFNEFISQLLWETAETGNSSLSVEGYRAPSWSWAAVDSRVRFDLTDALAGCSASLPCTITDVTCVTSEDPFGAVISGSISVIGCLAHSRPLEVKVLDLGLPSLLRVGKGYVKAIFDNKDGIHGDVDFFYLPLKAKWSNGEFSEKRTLHEIEGLVLTNNSVEAGAFKRIGLFRIDIEDYLQEFLGCLKYSIQGFSGLEAVAYKDIEDSIFDLMGPEGYAYQIKIV